MPRPNKPWYRKDRDVWVVKIAGKQIVLARGKSQRAAALKAFYALMLDPKQQNSTVTVARVVEFCYAWNRANTEHGTQMIYRRFLDKLIETHGAMDASLFTPVHVHEWVNSHPTWGKNTRHMAFKVVKRAWRLAKKEKLLAVDNMADMETPVPPPSDADVSPDSIKALIAGIRSKEFVDLMTFIYETGCRQGEARRIEACQVQVEGHVATLSKHKTSGKTRKPRRIYMSDKALEIVVRLSAAHPEGPIFRNRSGRPWTRGAICIHISRVRERLGLGKEVVAKALRSHWVTDALMRGVPIATVAELAGHANTRMIEQVYSKLSQRHDYLKQAAQTIRNTSVDTA